MTKALIISGLAPLMVKPADGELDDEGWYGQTIELMEPCADGWFRVRMPYGYETHVNRSHLCFDEAEIARYDRAALQCVWQRTADVLDAPSFQAARIMMLVRGGLVEPECVLGDGAWTRVRLIGGRTGYMRTSWLGPYHRTPNGCEEAFRNNVVETAFGYLGAQYRWGGKSALGIDCSGLASAAYLLNGVAIYRNARIMEGYPVHEIPRGKLKRGDLIFFDGHVALYVGNGRYIHATGRAGDDGCVINSLEAAHADYRADLAGSILSCGSIF